MVTKIRSRKLLAAQTAHTHAHAVWLWSLSLAIGVGAIVLLAPFIGIFLIFGSTALGLVLLVLAVITITIFCIWLGSRLNDKSQENFIAMIAQLKGALTASVREESRTRGTYERAHIHQERQQAQASRAHQPSSPTADELHRQAWASQFMNDEAIDGQWYAVDEEADFAMDDIV